MVFKMTPDQLAEIACQVREDFCKSFEAQRPDNPADQQQDQKLLQPCTKLTDSLGMAQKGLSVTLDENAQGNQVQQNSVDALKRFLLAHVLRYYLNQTFLKLLGHAKGLKEKIKKKIEKNKKLDLDFNGEGEIDALVQDLAFEHMMNEFDKAHGNQSKIQQFHNKFTEGSENEMDAQAILKKLFDIFDRLKKNCHHYFAETQYFAQQRGIKISVKDIIFGSYKSNNRLRKYFTCNMKDRMKEWSKKFGFIDFLNWVLDHVLMLYAVFFLYMLLFIVVGFCSDLFIKEFFSFLGSYTIPVYAYSYSCIVAFIALWRSWDCYRTTQETRDMVGFMVAAFVSIVGFLIAVELVLLEPYMSRVSCGICAMVFLVTSSLMSLLAFLSSERKRTFQNLARWFYNEFSFHNEKILCNFLGNQYKDQSLEQANQCREKFPEFYKQVLMADQVVPKDKIGENDIDAWICDVVDCVEKRNQDQGNQKSSSVI